MKFEIHFQMAGAGKSMGTLPHSQNPMESDSLKTLLLKLSDSIPDKLPMGIEFIGVTVKPVKEGL